VSCLFSSAVVAAAFGFWHWESRLPDIPSRAPANDDPRLTFETPYLNVAPEIDYVGDTVCWSCHPTQAKTYQRHPMFHTLAPLGDDLRPERYDRVTSNPFQAGGFQYQAQRHGTHVIHREASTGRDGEVLTHYQTEVQYAIGSGTHGCSFLFERDGYLFESPLSWFSQKQIWALSPGYDDRDHQHFERAVREPCLFCHSNRALAVSGTLNRYRPPIFEGFGIGCERCHGPGLLHVQQERNGLAGGKTIVNPADLPPRLRESVCEQCHLEGEVRILRRGRAAFDFRPGLPVDLLWSVFVKAEVQDTEHPAVGQVEQMHESRCFKASDGKLGCTSCHDPHSIPAAEQKVNHYRSRCLECHRQKPCRLPERARHSKSPVDNCVLCHMPRESSSDVAHHSITDHRVRVPDRQAAGSKRQQSSPLGLPLVLFHKADEMDDLESARDLGIALTRSTLVDLRRPDENADARRLLETALRKWPDDVEAWCALGMVYHQDGRPAEALAAYQRALVVNPDYELALYGAAACCTDQEQAIVYWKKALCVDPWRSSYHSQLGKAYSGSKKWELAAGEFQAALRLNPANLDDRKDLVRCLTRQGKHDEAREQLRKWLALQPHDASRNTPPRQ
jgi:predicted CXXCH cytochrome family protein